MLLNHLNKYITNTTRPIPIRTERVSSHPVEEIVSCRRMADQPKPSRKLTKLRKE